MLDPSTICFRCVHNERHQAKKENRALTGPCRCLVSGKDVQIHQAERQCPEGYFDGQTPLVQVSPRSESREVARKAVMSAVGPKLWQELHEYAVGVKDTKEIAAWLDGFAKRLPCGECRKEWKRIVADVPPITLTPYLFFLWTVRVHNRVNEKLGKPEMSEVDAISLYYRRGA